MAKKEKLTAIIVNARGEVFTGWAIGVSCSVSGGEYFYRVPKFNKTETRMREAWQFWPTSMQHSKRQHYTINKPYVFSCREYAEKAANKMYGVGRIAVVT